MTAKTDVRPIISDHYATLVNQSRSGGRPTRSWMDWAIQVGLPLAAGGGAALLGWRLGSMSDLLDGAAILTAFSFGLAVFAFETRASSKWSRESTATRLLDEFFSNVLYSVLVGLTLTVLLVIGAAAASTSSLRAGAVGLTLTALTSATATHYVLVILMCLKRLRAAYRDLQR